MKVFSLLFTLAMVLCIFTGIALGTSMIVRADNTAYANFLVTDSDTESTLPSKVVRFNNFDWYIIADESTAVDAGTVTLFAKAPIGESKFDEDDDNPNYNVYGNYYSTSSVKSYLDKLTDGVGSFADVADAIVDVNLTDVSVTNAKLIN